MDNPFKDNLTTEGSRDHDESRGLKERANPHKLGSDTSWTGLRMKNYVQIKLTRDFRVYSILALSTQSSAG